MKAGTILVKTKNNEERNGIKMKQFGVLIGSLSMIMTAQAVASDFDLVINNGIDQLPIDR